jgi:uncharacterized integral membrane protein
VRWVKIVGIALAVILLVMIYKGQTTQAANIVGGIFSAIGSFVVNLGSFFGKLFS